MRKKPPKVPFDHPVDTAADATTISPPEAEFGERLATLRALQGLNHDALSELTKIVDPQSRGIARTTLRGYELGTYKPGIRELRILSQALEVTPTDLIFGGDRFPSSPPVLDSGRRTFFDIDDAHFHKWAPFLMALYKMSDSSRDAVFRVAAQLLEAQLGVVEYQRLMGATTETVGAILDAQRDSPQIPGGLPSPEVLKALAPILVSIKKKFGYSSPDIADNPSEKL